MEKALSASSVRDFERAISMVSYGFDTIEDFYAKSSTRDVINKVKVPVLFIQVLFPTVILLCVMILLNCSVGCFISIWLVSIDGARAPIDTIIMCFFRLLWLLLTTSIYYLALFGASTHSLVDNSFNFISCSCIA